MARIDSISFPYRWRNRNGLKQQREKPDYYGCHHECDQDGQPIVGDQIADVGAHHYELTMGEVNHSHDAEDDGETECRNEEQGDKADDVKGAKNHDCSARFLG